MRLLSPKLLKMLTFSVIALVCGSAVCAANKTPQRKGKVIIIRGAFTVFSLGLNDLGDKLAAMGLDVEVVPDILAGSAAAEVREERRRRGEAMGPIIFIGHSRGAELGPREARYLKNYGIPVKLIVMVDAVHETTIPSNVERCVNLYHTNSLGVLHGVPARAESKRTKLLNTDIAKLKSRDKGGMINHFNMDASPWIHELVIAEVLKVCPEVKEIPKVARSTRQKEVPKVAGSTRQKEKPYTAEKFGGVKKNIQSGPATKKLKG